MNYEKRHNTSACEDLLAGYSLLALKENPGLVEEGVLMRDWEMMCQWLNRQSPAEENL